MEQTPYKRRSLIPRSAIIAGVVVTVLVAGAIGASVAVYRTRLVTVPDLAGLSSAEALRTLADAGLESEVQGSRVSADLPEGAVLSQDPSPDSSVPQGSVVSLIVSAGSQTVRVPDLVGVPVDEARVALEDAGFRIEERTGSTEESRSVVLEMYPAPGTLVNVGDSIRITIPGESGESDVLLPYDLSAFSVLVDPAPPEVGESDPALEVGRRLVSLLQASGANATLTRTTADAEVTRGTRVALSRESTAAVFVGLEVGAGTGTGVTALYRTVATGGGTSADLSTLAKSITSALRLPGGRVNPPAATDDPVLGGFKGDGARVRLGDARDDGDVSRFKDPAWADEVARSIYRALGEVYGTQ